MNLKEIKDDINNQIKFIEKQVYNKNKKINALKNSLQKIELFESKYNVNDIEIENIGNKKIEICSPSLAAKCNKMQIHGNSIRKYFIEDGVYIYGARRFMYASFTYGRDFNTKIRINDYDSYISENFKDKKNIIKKIEKRIIKLLTYKDNNNKPIYVLDKNSFNYERISDLLIFI